MVADLAVTPFPLEHPNRTVPADRAGIDDAATTMELSIVMPCLNEARTVGACVTEAVAFLRSRGIRGEVVVADNGSEDGSQELAREAGARVVHAVGRGYGRALQTGIRAARGRYVIMGDSDLSYDFSDLDGFLTRLRAGDQLVMGNRFQGGIAARAMPFLHRYLGNPVLSATGRLFFGGGIHDFHCGLRGFERASILKIAPQSPGMEFASELVIRALLQSFRVNEVPTRLRRDGRDRRPHLRTWRDGWRHLRLMMFYSPRWLFGLPGLCCALVGMLGTLSLWASPTWLGPLRLDAGSMGVFGLLWLVGTMLLSFGVCARQTAGFLGLLPPKPTLDRLIASDFLEPALMGALGLGLLGLGLLVYDFGVWWRHGFGALEPEAHLRRIILGSTLVCLAIQGASACFYLGLLRTAETRSADRP